jgi:hypothetical protein
VLLQFGEDTMQHIENYSMQQQHPEEIIDNEITAHQENYESRRRSKDEPIRLQQKVNDQKSTL